MKEKKHGGGPMGPGGGGADKEEEKNGLEKFEDEFKGTIFNVLYVLLKDDETSHWKHILGILLDFIQIYYYSFATIVIKSLFCNGIIDYFIDGVPLEIRHRFELCINIPGILPCLNLARSFRYDRIPCSVLLGTLNYLFRHTRCILRFLFLFKEKVCIRLANASSKDNVRIICDCSLFTVYG